MNIKNRTILFFFLMSFLTNAKAWETSFNNSKCFIENKGQFQSSLLKAGESILYAYDEGNTKVYFTNLGVIYSFVERERAENTLSEKRQGAKLFFNSVEEYKNFEREEFKHDLIMDNVRLEWIGCNDAAMLVVEGHTSECFSYSYYDKGTLKNVSNLKGAKKITYKSIYPGIDLEYVFHEQGGLKYSLVLHPGANPSVFKTAYNKPIVVNEKGQTVISTKFGEIIEQAPLCFYSDNQKDIIQSKFIFNNGVLQFQLNSFNSSRKIIVDPWIQLPLLNVSNSVWECERDTLGNVYIMGGDLPMKVQKYNSSGTLQWTYNTPYDTTNWLGTIATDYVGNTYLTQGSSAQILKLNSSGNLVWQNTNPIASPNGEMWSLIFNADQSKLYAGGADMINSPLTMFGKLFEINTSNGNVIVNKTISISNPLSNPSEVRALALAPSGKLFALAHDSIYNIAENFDASSIYGSGIPSSFPLAYKCERWRYDNSGIQAIKANGQHVYTNTGLSLVKRNLSDGTIISSVTIPNGNAFFSSGEYQVYNSGIDIDACGNIYVGSVGAVVKFDSTLNFIDSVQLPFTVFDVFVNKNGEVVVAGSTTQATGARTGYITSVALSACNPYLLPVCTTNILGNVSSSTSGVLANGGNAVLYNHQPFFISFDTIQQSTIDGLGNFNFTSVPQGDYIIKIFPNAGFPNCAPTYYNNQYLWDSATVITHTCLQNDTANILMVDLQPLAGPGQLNGLIFEGAGFNRLEGDPIPGIDVKLGRNPGGQLVANTQTDVNGAYTFANIPLNDGGSNGVSYTIYVDIPGLEKDSSYSIVLNAGTTSYSNLNYLVDSNSVYIDNNVTAVSSNGIKKGSYRVYPNPFSIETNVSYYLSANSDVKLELYSTLGVRLQTLIDSFQSAGEYKYSIENLTPGIYYVHLIVNGNRNILKTIKVN